MFLHYLYIWDILHMIGKANRFLFQMKKLEVNSLGLLKKEDDQSLQKQ